MSDSVQSRICGGFLADFSPVFGKRRSFVKHAKNSAIKLHSKQLKACKILLSKRFALLYGGARSGKTVLILLYLLYECLTKAGLQVLILRRNFLDLKRTIIDDTLRDFIFQEYDLEFTMNLSSPARITFSNGSSILFSGVEGSSKRNAGLDKHLGGEFSKIYLNEASQIEYDIFRLVRTRLNAKKRRATTHIFTQILVDCNPPTKLHWLYKYFILNIEPSTEQSLSPSLIESLGVCQLNPADNLENLSDREEYLENLKDLGGSYSRRFLLGEFTEGSGSSYFNKDSVKYTDLKLEMLDLDYIAVGLDVAARKGDFSDETGIVSVGSKRIHGQTVYYVLEDCSGKYSPKEWTDRVVSLCESYRFLACDITVVVETNQGGDMIKQILEDNSKERRYFEVKEIHSMASKSARALPVAHLYQRGLVTHLSYFDKLEEQLFTFGDRDYNSGDDRVDALVYAIRHLYVGNEERVNILYGL